MDSCDSDEGPSVQTILARRGRDMDSSVEPDVDGGVEDVVGSRR